MKDAWSWRGVGEPGKERARESNKWRKETRMRQREMQSGCRTDAATGDAAKGDAAKGDAAKGDAAKGEAAKTHAAKYKSDRNNEGKRMQQRQNRRR